jgi:uncharacterized protein YdhG (YjbR/CyaY superfamily)
MFNIKEILNNSLYRVKNSNIIVYFSVNPTTWKLKPTLKKVPTYADEWLYDPTLVEYKLTWLFIRISLYIETATHDLDDIYDII